MCLEKNKLSGLLKSDSYTMFGHNYSFFEKLQISNSKNQAPRISGILNLELLICKLIPTSLSNFRILFIALNNIIKIYILL